MASEEEERNSVYRNLARGSFWAVLMRWLVRVIGAASVVVLARVLTPQDFGIVAMATLVSGYLLRFSELSAGLLLIREPSPSKEDQNTAWTISVLQGLVVGSGLVILSPLAADYFSEPRLVAVMCVLAVSPIVGGFESIGPILVRKELDFAKDFRFNVYKRVGGVAVTIALALLLRDYWALVLGQIGASALGLVFSFAIHPYRPGFSLAGARKYLRFAASTIPIGIATYTTDRIAVLVGGRFGTPADLGRMTVAGEIATMATEEIAYPIERALFPSMAKLANAPQELARVFAHTLGVIVFLSMPIGFGLAAVARDFVGVLLGPNWTDAVWMFQIFAIYGVIKTISRTVTRNIMLVSGRERLYAMAVWIEVAITMAVVSAGGLVLGMDGVVLGALAAAVLNLPLMIRVTMQSVPVSLSAMAKVVWRPVLAAVVMHSVVRVVHSDAISAPWLRLVLDIGTGILTYGAVVTLSWWASGRPDGVERALVTLVRARLARSRPEKP